MDTITGYAKGETIYLTYTDIEYAGKEPDSPTGLTFFFTVVEVNERTEVARLTSEVGGGITVNDLGAELEVEVALDTDTADFDFNLKYETDFWVVDTATGKHRLDTFRFKLDEPETTDFTA